MNPRISIIIVSWNTRELLARCLASLDRQLLTTNLEVIVVDNASHDGTAIMVRQSFPGARLLANERNVGFAAGCNQGIAVARANELLFLNPDTEVRPECLNGLLTFIAEHPEVGAVGPRLMDAEGQLQPSCHPAPTLFRELWRLLHLDQAYPLNRYPLEDWQHGNPRRVEVLQGACLLVRREALEDVGLLEEEYFMYSEEMDLCYRLRQRGWSLYWVPQAEVVHYGGRSTRQAPAEMFLELYRSKVIYFRRNHGLLSAQCYKALLAIASIVRLVLVPIAWVEGPAQRERHFTLGRDYLRLLATLPRM